jgi:hypothetical protein
MRKDTSKLLKRWATAENLDYKQIKKNWPRLGPIEKFKIKQRIRNSYIEKTAKI